MNRYKTKLFYPITFPVTTGAGTISVLFTLSAHSSGANVTDYMVSSAALMVAIILICAMIYIFYLNTKTIIHYLGSNGETIVNPDKRLSYILRWPADSGVRNNGAGKRIEHSTKP